MDPDGLNRDELYHTERNHPGLDNQLIAPGPEVGRTTGQSSDESAWAAY